MIWTVTVKLRNLYNHSNNYTIMLNSPLQLQLWSDSGLEAF